MIDKTNSPHLALFLESPEDMNARVAGRPNKPSLHLIHNPCTSGFSQIQKTYAHTVFYWNNQIDG